MRLFAPGFLIGILAVSALPVMPGPRAAWLLGAAGLLLPLTGRRIRIVVFAVLVGGVWTILVAHAALEARLVTPPRGVDRIVTGRVVGLPRSEPGRLRFLFAPDPVEGQQDLPSRIRISWYRSLVTVAAGERWRLSLRLRAPRGQANPGGFDYERWLLLNGIGATGYVRKSGENQLLHEAPALWSAVRGTLADTIHRALQDSP
ncbi:MAG: ComEC/Rec2 family competence protein, partial [Gammaproteobacteria bacterium]